MDEHSVEALLVRSSPPISHISNCCARAASLPAAELVILPNRRQRNGTSVEQLTRTPIGGTGARRLGGQHIELLVPGANVAIARIFDITGLGSRVTMHRELDQIANFPAAVST